MTLIDIGVLIAGLLLLLGITSSKFSTRQDCSSCTLGVTEEL